MHLDLTLFAASGLTQGELAWIFKVSRVTANKWVHGSPVGPKSVPRLQRIEPAISAAIKAKALPLPSGIESVQTAKFGKVRTPLSTIIKTYLDR